MLITKSADNIVFCNNQYILLRIPRVGESSMGESTQLTRANHLRPNLDIPFIMDLAFCIIGGTLPFFGADGRLAMPAVGSETCSK